MSMARLLRLLLLLTAVAASRCAIAAARGFAVGEDYIIDSSKLALRPSVISCSTASNYTDGDQYHKNLDLLLSVLPTGAADNFGFYNDTFGMAADEVFVLFMCYVGGDDEACQDCITKAPAGIMQLCPHSRKVGAVYDACVLRYSDEPFFSVADLTVAQAKKLTGDEIDSQNPYVVDTASMNRTRFELMNLLAGSASRSAMRLAEEGMPYTGSRRMYGKAQCTRDLPVSECSRCLSHFVEMLPELFPNNSGGAIKGYSCYLEYSIFTTPPLRLLLPWEWEREQAYLAGKRHKRLPVAAVAGVVVGCVAFALCLCLLVFILWHRRQKRAAAKLKMAELEQPLKGPVYFHGKSVEDELEQGTGPRRFSYDELAAATDHFSDENKLGEGGFGSVYRGFLSDMNLYIAVKRVSKNSRQGWKEFVSEVKIISRLRHRNLVQLIGWHYGGGEGDDNLLLVYELMPNGSLDAHLYKEENLLSWPVRYEIVLGIGSALLYLHQETEQRVVHRDIKPSNVMLDASFNAKLGDFGLARLLDDGRRSCTTGAAGTLGYMDPKCVFTTTVSVESDVYSFGVVLLEIACGRRPAVAVQGDDEGFIHLAQWVRESYDRGNVLEGADARLDGEFDGQEMERVVVVGLWCVHPDSRLRRVVVVGLWWLVSVLRFEAPLPSLPATMPVATYLTPAADHWSSSSGPAAATTLARRVRADDRQNCDEIAAADTSESQIDGTEDGAKRM